MKTLKVKSILIVGITGGIGFELYKAIKRSQLIIYGYYFSNEKLALKLMKNKNISLAKIDLSLQNEIKEFPLLNYEALVYVAGIPHYTEDVFQFNNEELQRQININISSLFNLIKQSVNSNESSLKKIVIISSRKSDKIKSIYHLFKHLQEEMLLKLRPAFLNKNISISIIRTGWVNTNMYKQFIHLNPSIDDNPNFGCPSALSPKEVAKVCIDALNNFSIFQEYDLTNTK